MEPDERDWYTPLEAATLLGVDESTVRRWIRERRIAANRTLSKQGRYRITAAELGRVRERMGA